MAKRKADEVPLGDGELLDPADKLEITPLGAGSEVGRSCVFLTFKGKNVMFDCGIHPAHNGIAALPFFDAVDPSTIDVLLITHFHLDHSASLPYFLEKTGFTGRVFMTHATRAVYRLLVTDYLKVSKGPEGDQLFTEKDIEKSMDRIEVIDFHQIQEVNGIKFWCYTAGHVLGAAMFVVDIAGVRVLYTGDYSREEDRHLRAAEMPPFSPEVCIIESTYGVQQHQPRESRERLFTTKISEAVLRGGRVLIPAFALGRAQELLLILDDYWEAHKAQLEGIPIYYASPLANRCMAVYQTYINSMNDRVREQHRQANPFAFRHIRYLSNIREFQDSGPCVVMASPGGLQSGLSRQLFDMWCQDKRNACIIPGYVVEGTLAKTILTTPPKVTLASGLSVPLRMSVDYISFSAHADFTQTNAFLTELAPANIVLVHGEANEMGRLKSKLAAEYVNAQITRPIFTPKNCKTVELYFKGQNIAKAVGRLAEKMPLNGAPVSGLLVKKGFSYQLLSPEDLPIYTQLAKGAVIQRQHLHFAGSFAMLRYELQRMFEGVQEIEFANFPSLDIDQTVTVIQESAGQLVLQWVSDPISDMVADAVVSKVLSLGGRDAVDGGVPGLPSILGQGDGEGEAEEEARGKWDAPSSRQVEEMKRFLEQHFGEVEKDVEARELRVNVDGQVAAVGWARDRVSSQDEGLRSRVQAVVDNTRTAIFPLKIQAAV
eukprot:TRINITY_DN2346_c1_g2_i1.p1 TRINITY_DN2346_c1_g2~~TRINITY_DN2346_c1_g2_i1.p1  ORF type:complete len:714 (+),score=162.17 TRINITY_DN2346_c1_g2_i1:418-2559(+)